MTAFTIYLFESFRAPVLTHACAFFVVRVCVALHLRVKIKIEHQTRRVLSQSLLVSLCYAASVYICSMTWH